MARDPYQYFRIEARELLDGLSQGALDLEKRGADASVLSRLLRLAHTLKGAARVVKLGSVAERAHEIEEILAPIRGFEGAVPSETTTRLLALVDDCEQSLKEVFAPAAAQGPAAEVPEEAFTSVRVRIEEMDALLHHLSDASGAAGSLRHESLELARLSGSMGSWLHTLPRTGIPADVRTRLLAEHQEIQRLARSLASGSERSAREFQTIRDEVNEMRLLPARSVFGVLERAARDTADTLGKSVSFSASGGDHRLDAHVLLAVRDALGHVVRNAVAHGIESEANRRTAGKASPGAVSVEFQKAGPRIRILVTDDGGGVDLEAVRSQLSSRGMITAGTARTLDLKQAIELLFHGGVSTASELTQVMGRGIGLDAVRATVARLKGEVELRSEPGRGTTVELIVPVTLEAMDVLGVVVGSQRVLIPFSAVVQTVRVLATAVNRSPGGDLLVIDGEALPFARLESLLRGSGTPDGHRSFWSVVVIECQGGRGALGVDAIREVSHTVFRPLPAVCGTIPMVTGAAQDAHGVPELLLDPAEVLAAARSGTFRSGAVQPPPAARILVVDDSLTSRMLEQTILESAGFIVDLAVSGEDALEKMKVREYDLFLVDVEMPGMDGFQLLERLRDDAVLRRTPAVLVTSRVSPADLERGKRAGARAHLSKGAFQEAPFLETIRRLVRGGAS